MLIAASEKFATAIPIQLIQNAFCAAYTGGWPVSPSAQLDVDGGLIIWPGVVAVTISDYE